VYTIRAGGVDIWGTGDEFHYVYQPVSGDLDVVARVVSLGAVDVWSKAGVMIRESLSAGSAHAMVALTPGNGWVFQRRAIPGGSSSHTQGDAGVAPGWVRLVRRGSLVEAYQSRDGQSWAPIGSDTIPMTNDVYVGIAVTSHEVDLATVAIVDNLRITEATVASNRPPTVSLTSPLSGQQFTAPATFTLAAAATDIDGRVESVEFYADSTLLGRVTSAPYSYTVNSMPQGTYGIRALAVDDGGASSMSETAVVTVSVASIQPPRAVVFVASVDHATLVTKYVLEIYRSGTEPGADTPVATSDLGKPAVDGNGEITVDRSAFFQALAAGDYIATVSAVGATASARSGTVSFSR
ncbi:MAG: hypothetical protein H0W08_10590, partial [Acidobacteria bacterium]|nr:hypothetical protein [Acidobacteriota bacterium]